MAADDDFSGDLYGDLDLEDIDATQLDLELNEPPEPEPPVSAPAPAPAPAQAQNQNQNQYNYGQQPAANNGGGYDQNQNAGGNNHGASGSGGQPSFGGYGGGNEGGDRIKPNEMPDEGKMFIGGLNWETDDEGLKSYMSQFGEIDACTIMRDPSGRSRGFAFLTYTNAASVTKVMNQVHHLDGKQIDPKRAIPKAEHEKTAKVFVGGLAPSVTSESLKIFLHQFGEVHDATVMFDRETGRSKGFAFATFADEESVPIAMNASGIELDGKAIEIKKAQPRGSGNLVKNFAQPGGGGQQGGRFNQQPQGGMGMMGGGGGFDPNAMAMMYQNMMKGGGGMGGGMGMGFDPNAMAMMYQNMMKNMAGMNAPAINPNMAMRNGGMGMMGGMGGMGGMPGMGGMGAMGGMGGMGMMGNGMGMMGNNMGGGMRNQPGGAGAGAPRGNVPNAPRGPAAMRGPGSTTPQGGSGAAGGSSAGGGGGAQRYSTQGNARAKPY